MNRYLAPLAAVALIAAAPAPKAVLSGGGFAVQGQAIKFGVPAASAIAAMAKARGAPLRRGHYDGCGPGSALDYARYRGGLDLTFENGKFIGWEVGTKGDPTLRTNTGIGLGSTVIQLEKAYPLVFVDPGGEEGGSGPTWSLDDGPNGFLDGDRRTSKVTRMFAGVACILN